ncbi:hypothetical protein PCYB_084450 [Plasmodium cynomolgi strain B]|uniref:Uncharacterized protein n=1 Tax=Plasmodium cynomolgi (strain B) TaxID=1120755 RepID=K6USQ6_PLACD|nr:hypothetical protein PCYB_084450 [Plasmodium cynomolgi strain B]GAB66284.1 hypothetical protein PCYB_084450 [Plasmodium cynomolgi strain B]
MTRQPLYTRREIKVSLVCPFVCLFILHHLVLFLFAFSEGNLLLGLRKRRNSRTSNSSFNESFDSSHEDWDGHSNYYNTSFNDSDFEIEDSETENSSTSRSNLSSPSTEGSPDSPYNMESILQATLPLLGEEQFPRRDEQGNNKNMLAQSPTEGNLNNFLLRGSIKNFSPGVTPPSSPPKDDPPELLSRRDNTRRSQSKKETLKKLPLQLLRGVSPFRQTLHGRRNSHGNHQSDCEGPREEGEVGEGSSHGEDFTEKEAKMKEWDNEKESELKRLKTLFCLYEQKKEEIRKRRLHRNRSAHKFNNDGESHPDIPNEDNYKNMKDMTMEVNSLLDNVSLASLPIEFIDE